MSAPQIYVLLGAIAAVSVILLIRPLRRAAWTLLRFCSGFFCYCVMSFALAPLGIILPLNPVTALVSLTLGVPGIILIVLVHSLYL